MPYCFCIVSLSVRRKPKALKVAGIVTDNLNEQMIGVSILESSEEDMGRHCVSAFCEKKKIRRISRIGMNIIGNCIFG